MPVQHDPAASPPLSQLHTGPWTVLPIDMHARAADAMLPFKWIAANLDNRDSMYLGKVRLETKREEAGGFAAGSGATLGPAAPRAGIRARLGGSARSQEVSQYTQANFPPHFTIPALTQRARCTPSWAPPSADASAAHGAARAAPRMRRESGAAAHVHSRSALAQKPRRQGFCRKRRSLGASYTAARSAAVALPRRSAALMSRRSACGGSRAWRTAGPASGARGRTLSRQGGACSGA